MQLQNCSIDICYNLDDFGHHENILYHCYHHLIDNFSPLETLPCFVKCGFVTKFFKMIQTMISTQLKHALTWQWTTHLLEVAKLFYRSFSSWRILLILKIVGLHKDKPWKEVVIGEQEEK